MSGATSAGAGGLSSSATDSGLTPRIFENLFDLNESGRNYREASVEKQILLNSIKNKKVTKDMFILDSSKKAGKTHTVPRSNPSSSPSTSSSSTTNKISSNTQSSNVSPSSSSEIYYATPVHTRKTESSGIYQIVSVDNTSHLVSSPNESIYKEIPTSTDKFGYQISEPTSNALRMLNSSSLNGIAELKSFFTGAHTGDICVGQVGSKGAKLSLSCGMSN